MPQIVKGVLCLSDRDTNDLKMALRAVVKIAERECEVGQEILDKMSNIKEIEGVSYTYLYNFFKRLMLSRKPSRGFRLLERTGLLKVLFPEFVDAIDCFQNTKYHKDDVFTHCILACDEAEKVFEIRAAALLHDVGKPFVKTSVYMATCNHCGASWELGGQKEFEAFNKILNSKEALISCGVCGGTNITGVEQDQKFFKHEVKSDTMSKEVLIRFGVPKNTGLYIASLVRNHMYMYDREWTDKAVRKFIKKVGLREKDLKNLSNFPLFLVREADRKSRGLPPRTQKQYDFEQRILNFVKENGL